MSGAEIPWFTLNNGNKIPSIGIGCWLGEPGGGQRVHDMVLSALKNGYRHIDTASGYANEGEVGRAIRESKIPREEVFVTTKLWNDHHSDVSGAFERSLEALDTGYIDLYLMHWPQASLDGKTLQPNESPTIVETWKEMEKLLDTGKVKSIGVSNFGVSLLKQLADDPSVKVVPAANQIELHPFLPVQPLQEYAKVNNIVLTAYSPIGQPASGTASPLFSEPTIAGIAERLGITPAQVIFSWAVGHGIAVVPKSESPERQKKNIEVVKLTLEDMAAIDKIHQQPGKNRSLLSYHDDKLGGVFGWTYDQMGWTGMKAGGVIA